MNLRTRALWRIAPFAVFALLVVSVLAWQLPADAETARKAGPARSAPASAPVRATNDIIALPLNPVVPAGQRVCAAKTASGLGYTMLRPAAGTKPGAADFVLVNYIGYLAASGTVFDQGHAGDISGWRRDPGLYRRAGDDGEIRHCTLLHTCRDGLWRRGHRADPGQFRSGVPG